MVAGEKQLTDQLQIMLIAEDHNKIPYKMRQMITEAINKNSQQTVGVATKIYVLDALHMTAK